MADKTPQNQASRPGAAGFQLKKFPKEFEKSLTSGIDSVYMTILLICIFVSTFLVAYLSSNAIDYFGLTQAELSERTQKIIKKIYKVEEIEDEPDEPDEKEVSEEKEDEEKKEDRKKDIEKRKKQKQNQKVSASDRAKERRAAAKQRRENRRSQRSSIANSAQLALITGGVSSEGEAVLDVLGDANSGINLDDALAGTDGIAVASNSSAKTRAIKGARVGGAQNVGDLVSGVSGVSSTSLGGRSSSGIGFGKVQLNERESSAAGRSKGSVSAKLNSLKKAVDNCFKKEKRINPGLKGTIKVNFVINKRGQVRKITFSDNTLRNSKVEKCIKGKFRTLRFKRAKKDIKANMKYLFS